MDRQLLARATENSDAPTPGYMYLDIAKNAAGNPGTCAEIAKYLTTRLASKNNSNVKYKCLKVIAKTAVSPYLKGQFKRCLAQDPHAMAAIKDATQFRGPPDPVRGDEPYEKVRVAAKEALDAVYSDTPPDAGGGGGTPFATNYGPSAGGYGGGPSSQSYGGSSGGVGPRRMEGIGNPMFKDPRLEPEPMSLANMTVNDIVNEAAITVIGMIKDPLAKNVDVRIGGGPGHHSGGGRSSYSGPGGAGAHNRPPPGRSDLVHQTNGEWTMASNRGPGAVGPPPNYASDSAYYKSRESNAYGWAQKSSGVPSGVGGVWASSAPPPPPAGSPYAHQATPSITINSVGGGVVSATGAGGTAVVDGSYEKQLVMELCPPGGMKPEPPPDKLVQFARVVSSLNPDLVCPVLLDCLEEGQPWIIRAKALWVIDCCIQNGKRPDSPNNAYADFFHACSGEIAPLANHSRPAIREPARRVLNSIGVATPVGGGGVPAEQKYRAHGMAAPAPVAPPPAPVANLLDFDDEVPAPVAAPPPPPTQPASAPPQQPPPPPPAVSAGEGSLFGGLHVAGGAPPPAASAPPPAAHPAAPTSGNLLDFMSGDSPGGATPAPAPSSSFGFMNAEPQQPTTAPATTAVDQASGMFSNLSVKSKEGINTTVEAAATGTPTGSAFGFMNSSTTAAQVEPVVGVNAFDPLKNPSPTSPKKMMQISPEQMQAMMYQQMMMQQQMQLAQMQLALQQQQQAKRGSANSSQMFMAMPGHVMQNPAASKSTFAFMDKPQKQQDHSFDFVQDAVKSAQKK